MSENIEKSFADKVNEKINDWSVKLGDLKEQFETESNKSIDEFENQKAKLGDWVNEATDKIKKYADLDEAKVADFKNTLNDLKEIASQKKAETIHILNDQHQKLSGELDNLKGHLTKIFNESSNEVKAFSEDSLDKLEHFHSKLDISKLHAENLEKEGEATWNEKKKEITGKIQELKSKLENSKDLTEDTWENFSNEISDAWKSIRNAFKS